MAAEERPVGEKSKVDLEIEKTTLINVDTAFTKIDEKMTTEGKKEYVYYVLGPITYFDRKLVERLLLKEYAVHLFLQGGIETVGTELPWFTTLLGAIPANAGMDYENFYGFMEDDINRESAKNLHVYTQFTNMAKGGRTPGTLAKLWLGDIKPFLTSLETTEKGAPFAKLWEYYNRTTNGLAWQHDPIEVINSLGVLVGENLDDDYQCEKYKYMVQHKVPRTVTFYKTNDKGLAGILGTGGRVKLLDHVPSDYPPSVPYTAEGKYSEFQRYRFNQFIRLLSKSFNINASSYQDTSDDTNVDKMIEKFRLRFCTGISIEILDPDNNFAAELINYISKETADVFVHSQFYPEDVPIICTTTSGIPNVLSILEVPENVITDLNKKGKLEITGEIIVRDILTKMYDNVGNPITQLTVKGNYYSIIPFLGQKETFDARELMYGQYFGQFKQTNVDCVDADLNFMKSLLRSENVWKGDPRYGRKDTDRTFNARNLVHPVTQFSPSVFFNSGKLSGEFVDDVIMSLANTTIKDSTERKGILEEWKTYQHKGQGKVGGKSRKSKKNKRKKSKKNKRRKSKKNKSKRY